MRNWLGNCLVRKVTMPKYKEALCCKCMGEILVPILDSSTDFYCSTCAMSKVYATNLDDFRGEIDQYE